MTNILAAAGKALIEKKVFAAVQFSDATQVPALRALRRLPVCRACPEVVVVIALCTAGLKLTAGLLDRRWLVSLRLAWCRLAAERVQTLVAATPALVVTSIIVHGISVMPLMAGYRSRQQFPKRGACGVTGRKAADHMRLRVQTACTTLAVHISVKAAPSASGSIDPVNSVTHAPANVALMPVRYRRKVVLRFMLITISLGEPS